MIPCGNAYFQPQACCQHNDNCLESSVCYNSEHGVTYVAGCTDKEYNASVCPDKFDDSGELGQQAQKREPVTPFSTRETIQKEANYDHSTDAPWLGMAYCDDNSNNWVLCDQTGHPGTIVNPDPCACPTATAQRSMTLNQAQGIQETASLPGATGLPIGWNAEFYPTVPSTLSQPTSSSVRPSTGAITSSFPSTVEPTPSLASNIPSPPYPTGFNTSAKIGTAIGAAVFGIILLALVGFFVLRRRQPSDKQRQNNNPHGAGEKGAAPNPDPDPNTDPRTIGVAYGSGTLDVSQLSINAGSPRPSELENKAARPWSMISELDNGYDGCDPGGQGHMEAIMEASHGQNLGRGHARSQSEPSPSELEAPRGVVELPG